MLFLSSFTFSFFKSDKTVIVQGQQISLINREKNISFSISKRSSPARFTLRNLHWMPPLFSLDTLECSWTSCIIFSIMNGIISSIVSAPLRRPSGNLATGASHSSLKREGNMRRPTGLAPGEWQGFVSDALPKFWLANRSITFHLLCAPKSGIF